MFEMRFESSKYTILQDWLGPRLNFVLAGEELGMANGFNYFSVVFQRVVVYRMICLCACRRFSWSLPVRDIRGIGVKSGYRSEVEFAFQLERR